ncbi:MAG: T9SS type A sorting domain-containing protein [Candidatus Komeilibacteria bacterium]|nr:T9SS type A sorting domain-containing protein [Candidatus Komeilibacteria bacterium]
MFKFNGATAWFVNNTAQDGRKLFITAAHVYGAGVVGEIINATLYLNYESVDCDNSGGEPIPEVVNTQIKLLVYSPAGISTSDRVLVEVVGDNLQGLSIKFLGWDRRGSVDMDMSNAYAFHHPQQDVKKGTISSVIDWGDSLQTWPTIGAFEGGSSGAPLFDQNKRVRGHATYGVVFSCSSVPQSQIYFKKLEYLWAELSAHLDPINSGALFIDGLESALPVELTSFRAVLHGPVVELNWETATEVDNYGFEIQRLSHSAGWDSVGFVSGHGSSNSPKSYFFTDPVLRSGKIQYRLKQIDTDGTFEYSKSVEVDIVGDYGLSQNYPNPFNPNTVIEYSLPVETTVDLAVYNIIGQKVKTLQQGIIPAGFHKVEFGGNDLSSGVYIYRLKAGEYIQTRKMILNK